MSTAVPPKCLIEFNKVSYTVGNDTLLNALSFSADQHRIGIVGQNGSGKSTLARLLCGLVEPSRGSVTVAGIDVAYNRQAAIKTVGMLFQNPEHQIIFPTVIEELAFGLEQLGHTRHEARSKSLETLKTFGVEQWADKSISILSQGQRHLVCLMSVLLMKPRLVVLDEPYAGLDIPTSLQLNRHLQALPASLVHVSHQPDTFLRYDRVLWLSGGEIEMDGPPDAVLPAFSQRMQALGSRRVIV